MYYVPEANGDYRWKYAGELTCGKFFRGRSVWHSSAYINIRTLFCSFNEHLQKKKFSVLQENSQTEHYDCFRTGILVS